MPHSLSRLVEPSAGPLHTAPQLEDAARGVTRGGQVPGTERILTSPLVVALLFATLLLGSLSFAFWGIIRRTIASRLYDQAVARLDNGEYRDAIRSSTT